MLESSIVYKLVRIDDKNNLTSYCNSTYVLKYQIGTKTEIIIPHSKIFVFDTFENAEKFYIKEQCKQYQPHNPWCQYRILKCVGYNVIKPRNTKIGYYDYQKYWQLRFYRKLKTMSLLHNVPQGTLLCDSIIPLEIL